MLRNSLDCSHIYTIQIFSEFTHLTHYSTSVLLSTFLFVLLDDSLASCISFSVLFCILREREEILGSGNEQDRSVATGL